MGGNADDPSGHDRRALTDILRRRGPEWVKQVVEEVFPPHKRGRPPKVTASGVDNLLMVEADYLFSNSRFLCDGADAEYQGDINSKNDAFERIAKRFSEAPPKWWRAYLNDRERCAKERGTIAKPIGEDAIVKRLERLLARREFAIYREEFIKPKEVAPQPPIAVFPHPENPEIVIAVSTNDAPAEPESASALPKQRRRTSDKK